MKQALIALLIALAPSLSEAKKETYRAVPASSKILWKGSKRIGDSHNGKLQLKSGSLEVEKGAIVGGQFEIDMTSLSVDDIQDPDMNKKLKNHLHSDDFFSIDKYPTAVFQITKASPLKNGVQELSGMLTIKGKTHPLPLPDSEGAKPVLVKVSVKDGKLAASGKFLVNRAKYDVRYGSTSFFSKLVANKIINDDFTVDVDLVAAK